MARVLGQGSGLDKGWVWRSKEKRRYGYMSCDREAEQPAILRFRQERRELSIKQEYPGSWRCEGAEVLKIGAPC